MKDVLSLLDQLRRPGLLLRAARHGAADYRRDMHLPRLLGYGALPRNGPALLRLIEMEAALDARRTASDAGYSLIRHVDVLIALMGEARILRNARP